MHVVSWGPALSVPGPPDEHPRLPPIAAQDDYGFHLLWYERQPVVDDYGHIVYVWRTGWTVRCPRCGRECWSEKELQEEPCPKAVT